MPQKQHLHTLFIITRTHAREENPIVFATQKQPAKFTRDLRRIHEQLLPNSRVFFIVFAHKSNKDCAQTRSKSRTNPEQFAREFGGKFSQRNPQIQITNIQAIRKHLIISAILF